MTSSGQQKHIPKNKSYYGKSKIENKNITRILNNISVVVAGADWSSVVWTGRSEGGEPGSGPRYPTR